MKYDIWLHSTTLLSICITLAAILIAINVIIDDQIYDEDLFYLILQSTITLFSIIIALSIISIEHSASNHTSTILKLYMYDKFVILVLSQNILFVIGILITINIELAISSIITTIFAWNIIVLIIYLFYLLHIINPIFILEKIELHIRKEIKRKEKNILNDQTIANMSINDGSLLGILKYELVLENIIYESHRKRDHELTDTCLSIYANIMIDCTKHTKIKLINTQTSFIAYLVRKFDQYINHNFENYNIVSANQIIEKGIMLGMHFANKKYDDLNKSPLHGIMYSMTDLAKKCINDKIYSTFQIMENFVYIIVKSKSKNTNFLAHCIYNIVMENNFKNIALCNHAIKCIMEILTVMIINNSNTVKINFNYLNEIIENIKDKNHEFYSKHFHNKSNSSMLKYMNNTIIMYKNKKTGEIRTHSNLIHFINFIRASQPKEYDEKTSNLMYDLIQEIRSKIVNDDELKNKFMNIVAQIDLCLDPISDAVNRYQEIRDYHEYQSGYSANE